MIQPALKQNLNSPGNPEWENLTGSVKNRPLPVFGLQFSWRTVGEI